MWCIQTHTVFAGPSRNCQRTHAALSMENGRVTVNTLLLVTGTLLGYVLVDRFTRLLARFDRCKWLTALTLIALASFLAPWLDWASFSDPTPLRLYVTLIVILMTWKSATDDVDVVSGPSLWCERALLVLCAAGIYVAPGMVIPWLYLMLQAFHAWKHHGMFPLRQIKLFLAYVLLQPLFSFHQLLSGEVTSSELPIAPYLIVALALQVSHYFRPGLGKLQLGPPRHPWWWHNRLHLIMASAYCWGWARFLPERLAIRIIQMARPLNRPLQMATVLVETATILLPLHFVFLIPITIGLSLMHLGVFLATGILFWEWAATNLAIVLLFHSADADQLGDVFGWQAFVVVSAIVAIAPRTKYLWRTCKLSWWDTSFAARVHWEVVGDSGKIYGLYNNFLCPHEGLFGRCHGYFMIDDPVMTWHLGEVFELELRDAIMATGGRTEGIRRLQAKYGKSLRNRHEEQAHIQYLQAFFLALNSGARKRVLPRWLRWLKSPGGQFYYWGRRPGFHGQENIREVVISYREEFFDEKEFKLLEDRIVKRIAIPPSILDCTAHRAA